MGAHGVHHVPFGHACVRAVGEPRQCLRAQVRGQHDQRLLEIDGATLTVGQHAVVEHLQEHVEHVRVRLFDLVEEDHLIGAAANGLGQDTTLVVTDIARRRSDQAGDSVFLHEFAHVDPHHRGVVVEEIFGERLGQFGLADAGRAEEQERAEWPPLVVEPCPRAADGIGDGVDGGVLTDDAFVQALFHPQELLTLAFEHPGRGDAGPALDHLGDLLGAHGLFDEERIALRLGLAPDAVRGRG